MTLMAGVLTSQWTGPPGGGGLLLGGDGMLKLMTYLNKN